MTSSHSSFSIEEVEEEIETSKRPSRPSSLFPWLLGSGLLSFSLFFLLLDDWKRKKFCIWFHLWMNEEEDEDEGDVGEGEWHSLEFEDSKSSKSEKEEEAEAERQWRQQ
jgi:hypothetical protein